MSDNAKLVQQKLDQAVGILNEQDVDMWMTFVRETALTPDPCLDLILGMDMVWQSAFIITKDNRRIAIVGKHDAENVEGTGGYTEIVPYVEGIREALVKTLLELNPRHIALNYSENDVASDGLGHGLMLLLQHYLSDTDLPERFISSENIVGALRGRKSDAEVDRVRKAVATTQQIFQEVAAFIEPGKSETEVAGYAHQRVTDLGLGTSWDWEYCPTVSAGPDSPIGHAGPLPQYKVARGQLVHMDFGVRENDYCADVQRTWYVRKDESDTPPQAVLDGFKAARAALQAGFDAIQPGVMGWEVDAAARKSLLDAGYPDCPYAFGHHVGRSAHDGATVLGPRWERYGQTPYGVLEAGNVFAIELGVAVEGYGYVGLEDNILVTEDGAAWLTDPEDEMWVI